MALSQTEILPYLMQRELVTPQSVVDHSLAVIDVSRRNQNFKVVSSEGPHYLIKQGAVSDGVLTVAREGAVYEYLQTLDREKELARHLPHFYGYDSAQQCMLLELIPEAEDLRRYHTRLEQFPTSAAAQAGSVLGRLHRLTRMVPVANRQKEPGFRAWALSLHQPEQALFDSMSAANIKLVRIIQQYSEYQALLDQLRIEWEPECLIHGDIKWDNFLIRGGAGDAGSEALVLVDWELAAVGDPCWDAGSVFADYLAFWLNSIPITGETPPEQFAELAGFPLERMQPAMGAFWRAYVTEAWLDPKAAGEAMLKAVRYAGARLIQTAYEYSQAAVQFTGNIICMLQISWNILDRPQEAAVELLGLPWVARRR